MADLHRRKSQAYGDSWKKRGEVLSILANEARKVDRLEALLGGAVAPPDENVLDTALDLFVYCLKHQAFLADADPVVAQALNIASRSTAPYSDGIAAFELLLEDTAFLETTPSAHRASQEAITAFGGLEACYQGLTPSTPPPERLARVQELANAAWSLALTIWSSDPLARAAFLSRNDRSE